MSLNDSPSMFETDIASDFVLAAVGEECGAQPPHRLSAQGCGSDGKLTGSNQRGEHPPQIQNWQ